MNTDLHELRDKQIGVYPCSSVVDTHLIKALPVDNDVDLVQALHEFHCDKTHKLITLVIYSLTTINYNCGTV